MWRLQCFYDATDLCRGTEFNCKCGSSTTFASLSESPLTRDTVANANRTWQWHLWKPLPCLTFGREYRAEGRCGPCVDLLQSPTLATPTILAPCRWDGMFVSAFRRTPLMTILHFFLLCITTAAQQFSFRMNKVLSDLILCYHTRAAL